ncbi:hypothetical protein A3F65_04315 [Candidatus Saccharibacteria bacterium RIFCSPHIGHO2_12_FULL_47_16b]|nr:MAG: hypothetical protein A3F65_04315 [Candidatus Saccharibacteria bacterium RIFCSPHIGHO2_12_FULL_47_16b]OGL40534.1 MAG: hypothetical protein A3J32_03185 [Candidatus Saccharibacteria bacterium RIFCSPLOWO2_02_FULL_46_7]
MLPEDKNTLPPQPNFDFIMKDEPKPKRKFGLPKMTWPMLVIVIGALLAILITIFGLAFRGSGNTEKIYSLISQTAEIVRVNSLATGQAKDADTKNLIVTASAALSSQQKQLQDYLSSKKVKIDNKKIAPAASSDIDNKLKDALANNIYDQTYLNYLKGELTSYQNSLDTAYQSAGSELKSILSAAYGSTAVILSAPQLK